MSSPMTSTDRYMRSRKKDGAFIASGSIYLRNTCTQQRKDSPIIWVQNEHFKDGTPSATGMIPVMHIRCSGIPTCVNGLLQSIIDKKILEIVEIAGRRNSKMRRIYKKCNGLARETTQSRRQTRWFAMRYRETSFLVHAKTLRDKPFLRLARVGLRGFR